MKFHKGCALAVLLPALCLALTAQNKSVFVNLTVKLNGKTTPPPHQVTLTFDGRSVTVPLQNGRFEVPPDMLQAKDVEFSSVVGNNKIHTSTINGDKFTQEKWTLVLEDDQFGVDFQPIPKGTKAACSCILVFESKTTEGTVQFDPHCRSQIQRSKK